jgi:hypothetical protein
LVKKPPLQEKLKSSACPSTSSIFPPFSVNPLLLLFNDHDIWYITFQILIIIFLFPITPSL